MANPSLKIRGSLSKLQREAARIYVQLQQRFEGNSLVSESWAAMGSDLQVQAESLKKLPGTFWQSMRKQESVLIRATREVLPADPEMAEGSLHSCLIRTLDIEEPMILRVYAPLIRRLRVEWTDRALDFYVMVKAHIARLSRMVQGYSGDPLLGQRCALLFLNFEKEVQEPAAIPVPARKTVTKSASRAKPSAGRKVKKAAAGKAGAPSRQLKARSKLAKRLAKNVEISRRRAQR